jgi:hypothetical protein
LSVHRVPRIEESRSKARSIAAASAVWGCWGSAMSRAHQGEATAGWKTGAVIFSRPSGSSLRSELLVSRLRNRLFDDRQILL